MVGHSICSIAVQGRNRSARSFPLARRICMDGLNEAGMPGMMRWDAPSQGVEGVPAANGQEEALIVGKVRGTGKGADEVG